MKLNSIRGPKNRPLYLHLALLLAFMLVVLLPLLLMLPALLLVLLPLLVVAIVKDLAIPLVFKLDMDIILILDLLLDMLLGLDIHNQNLYYKHITLIKYQSRVCLLPRAGEAYHLDGDAIYGYAFLS